MLKIRGTELLQRISELQVEALGSRALQLDGDGEDVQRVAVQYMNLRKLSMNGGSNEIQRNIIAQMVLQL